MKKKCATSLQVIQVVNIKKKKHVLWSKNIELILLYPADKLVSLDKNACPLVFSYMTTAPLQQHTHTFQTFGKVAVYSSIYVYI